MPNRPRLASHQHLLAETEQATTRQTIADSVVTSGHSLFHRQTPATTEHLLMLNKHWLLSTQRCSLQGSQVRLVTTVCALASSEAFLPLSDRAMALIDSFSVAKR